MEKLTPEQENAALRAEMAGFINQDSVGRNVDPAKSAAFYKRAAAAFRTRFMKRAEAKALILKHLNTTAAA